MARKRASILDDLFSAGKAGVTGAAGGLASAAALGQEAIERAGNVVARRKVFDEDATGLRSIAQDLAASADASRAQISETGRAAMESTTPRGNLLRGEFDLGDDPSLRGAALNITQGLGSIVPGTAAALATRGQSLRTQATVGAGVGGAVGGGFAAQDEGGRVRAMAPEQITQLPAYQQALAGGMNPEQAREAAARTAERGAFVATAPVSAAGGAATSALFGRAAQGVIARAAGGSRVGQGIASGLVGGVEEGLQEVGEGVAQRVGASAATGEQGREIGEESAANLALGAATGAPVGALGGAMAPKAATAPGPSAPQNIQPAQPVVVDPSRGVLSRAVAAGAAEGSIPGVVVEPDGLSAPPADGSLFNAPAIPPPTLPEQAVAVLQAEPTAAAQAAERGMPYAAVVDGRPLVIPPFRGLSPEERMVEVDTARRVLADLPGMIDAYRKLKGTDGGRIINTDEARELFPVYNSGPEGRSKYAVAVHEPSSFLSKQVWSQALEREVAPDRDPLVLFTAGGTGAGKTTAISRDDSASAMYDAADLIYDGNLQSVDGARERIEQSIESGRKVAILYVHRDPIASFTHGAIPRANREDYGRTVPIPVHASTHIGAARTIQQLAEIYRDDPNVSITMLDNAGNEVPVHDAVASVSMLDQAQLEEQLYEAARESQRTGAMSARVARFYFGDEDGEGSQPRAGEQARPAGDDAQDRGAGAGKPVAGQGAVASLGSSEPATPAEALFADLDDSTTPNPFGGGEQIFMHEGGGAWGAVSVARDINRRPDVVHLNAIRSFSPGSRSGHGSHVLKQLLDRADRHGVTIELTAVPYGTKDLKKKDLIAWYKRNGFEGKGEKLTRKPKVAALDRRPSYNGKALSTKDFGIIVAPKPGTKVNVDGEARAYRRGEDVAQPPVAAPVQRQPDLVALQGKAQAILKRPAAAVALRRLFGVKAVKLQTIRGSYEGEPELSFALAADGLGPDNAPALANFLGMAFAQDAVIVTKPDPVGPAEDSIPTLRLYNGDGTKLDDAVFDAVTAELRQEGVDYSEASGGREIRVLHFGDEAGLEALSTAMARTAAANGLQLDYFHTRSDLYEAQDYRRNLEGGGSEGRTGQRPGVFRALVDHFLVPYSRAVDSVGYRFDAQRYADRFGIEGEDLDYLTQQLQKFEPRSTAPLLSGEEAVPATDGRRQTNIDAGWFLQNRAAAMGVIKPEDRSAEAKEAISETFAQEVEYQLDKPGGKQAIGWYDRQLSAAMDTIAQAHPEIASDENANFVFKALLAITSQGTTVVQNFNTALRAYQRYLDTGKIALKGVSVQGPSGNLVRDNVAKLDALIKKHGMAGAREWLRGMHTVRELKAAGFKAVNGRLNDSVRGWHAFGPKIGSFANNLDGDFDTLTADLWFTRTWNRALGTMFSYSAAVEVKQVREFRAALVEALNEPGTSEVVDGLSDTERASIGTLEGDFAIARKITLHYRRNGFKDRSPVNTSAKKWVENVEELTQAPRGDPERRWQNEVMREVQDKVEARTGQRVSIADLQALLWYQEKELFRLLGAANRASAPLDYQDAAKAAIAQVEGKALGRDGSNDARVQRAQEEVMRQYGAAFSAESRKRANDATIVETAYPLARAYLLDKVRRIARGSRVVVVSGTDTAASRVAVTPKLTDAEAAKVAAIRGIRLAYDGTFPQQVAAEPARVPPRFQVPVSVASQRSFAALEDDQQQQIDKALANLKRSGYPASWLKKATFFFAHNNDMDFVARFHLLGEAKGAVSLRQSRFGNADGIRRDLAHELAHAADFDPETGGFYSVNSPLFAVRETADGSIAYTGAVISELEANARDGNSPLYAQLQYPFKVEEFSPQVVQVEAFAQAVMLYTTHRAQLKVRAPSAYKLVKELFENERQARSGERGNGALQAALRSDRSGALTVRAEARQAGGVDRRVDQDGEGRPEAAGGARRPDVEGLDSREPLGATGSFDGYTIPSWEMGQHLSDEAGKRLDGYKSAAASGSDKLRTYLQDYFLPVKRVQQAIIARGGKITDDTDVYAREEVYYGRTGEQLRRLEDEHVKPLVSAMLAADVKQEDLELYLYAKFAPTRNARIAEINPKFPDGGSGMTNADAAQVLEDFDKAGLSKKLEALAKRVRALNDVRLRTLEEGNLLSPGEAELWRSEPDYVPLKGFAETVSDGGETVMPTGRGFSIGGREAHRALGRKSRASDIIANAIAQTEQAIIRAEKNRVAIALLRLAEENPNPALWTVDKTPEKPQLSAAGEVTYRKDNRHVLAENVVAVKIAGEQHFVTLNDKRLAAAMKNLGAAKTGAFLRAFSSINRFLSLTRTMLAPEFVLANFSRDIQTAAVNLTGEQSAAMAGRVIKDIPKAMRAMWGQLRGKSQGGEWARWAQEFADEGGMTSFVAQYTVEEQQAKINGLLKDAKGGSPAAIRRLAKGTLDLIEDANGAVENGTRLAAYANARRSGMSKQQAASLAKNLTVNFNRKGQAGPAINSLYLFYNASIQGTMRFARAMKSKRAQQIMAATAVLGYSIASMNRAIGGEDDDGEDRWEKIPDWVKARNLIIFIPGGDGAMVKIPLPYSYNLPFLIGGAAESMVGGDKPASSVAAGVTEAILTAFNPIGDLDLEGDSATALAKVFSPTAADPLVDIAVNRNFFGAPINPERSPFDKVPEPDSQLAFPSANPAARWLANALNTATGGDALRPGAIDVSPGSMVYIFDYLTGGTGSFVERSVGAVMLAASGEHVPVRTIPFARVFAGTLDERRVTDTFYRLRDDVNLKAEMAKAGIAETAGERQEALLGRRMAGPLKGAERQLRALRDQRKAALARGDKARVEVLKERERAIQLRFNTAYFKAVDAIGQHE